MTDDMEFMRLAIRLSLESVERGGGPFGAVVVKNGEVVATGSNSVTQHNDPTAHAEIIAIREAARKLNTYDLSGCIIYSSCEPCPMCLGAIYWAHFDKLFYANTKTDAQNIGFDDSFIYEELKLNPAMRNLPISSILREEALVAFEAWANKPDKTEY
ncbi:MAG: guanine deaminase [Bacteroidetes bacterium]|nr:guanine deaminase [Bacteroidota bacterium]